MHDLQTLKDINEQEAATRALNAIRKSAGLGKANRRKSEDSRWLGGKMSVRVQRVVEKTIRLLKDYDSE